MSENKKVMPDGDQYNGKLKVQYIKSYQMLCEDKFTAEEIQRELLENVRKSVQKMGEGVFGCLKAMVDAMRSAFHAEGLNKTERCQAASEAIEQARRYSTLSPRDYSLLSQAAKSYIHDVRYGSISALGNEREQILFRCLLRIYEAEFKEPVSQIENHHNGVGHLTVLDKFSGIDQSMEQGLRKLAEAACKKQSVKNLRLPKRDKKPVSVNENLL